MTSDDTGMGRVTRYVLSTGFPREHADGKYVLAKDFDRLIEQRDRLAAALQRSTHTEGDCDNLLCREQCAENRAALKGNSK